MSSSFSIQLTRRAQKDFQKLDPSIQKPILKTIKNLTSRRYSNQYKALKGRNIAQYRARVGDYRILYDRYDEDLVILILRIGHRKDIYRKE